MNYYAERDCYELDRTPDPVTGEPPRDEQSVGYYCRHVNAMTREDLHMKSAIAAELAWRDIQIDRLRAENANLRDRVEMLEDQIDSIDDVHTCSSKCKRPMCVMRRRIAELEALIANERGCSQCWTGKTCGSDCHMTDVAALGGRG